MNRMLVLMPFAVFCGTLLGSMIGSLWVQYHIGADMGNADPFFLIKGFPGWSGSFRQPWLTGYQITGAAMIATALLFMVLSFSQKLTEYGKSRFQTPHDMRRNGLLKPIGHGLAFGKIYRFGVLGRIFGVSRFISATYDRFPHCLVVAPTRAGKGVGYVNPNVLLFPGSTLVLDVKGEMFEATSRYRQRNGDEIFYFAPFDFDRSTHRYNPLERVAGITDPVQRYTELSKIADYFLVVSQGGNANDFLSEGRELFVAAGLLAIERGVPTIGEISRILFGDGATSEVYTDRANEVKHVNAARSFRKFAGYSDRTLSSHASVLGGAGMSLWNNPAIDRATSGNDFSFADMRRKPTSVYFVVNSDSIRTMAPLIRLFFGEAIATFRASIPDPGNDPWPVQMILDEFDQLGQLEILVQALKQLAGHGVRVSIITQSIPGLDKIYGENDRMSIESAAGMKFFLSPNDKKTAAEVSEALGKTTMLSTSDSYATDNILFGRRSISRRNEERPLLTPDEVRRLDPNKVILIPERQNPILAHRIIYYQDALFKKIIASQTGPLPYPDHCHELRELREELTGLHATVARLKPLSYPDGGPSVPTGQTNEIPAAHGQSSGKTDPAQDVAKRAMDEAEASKDVMSEEDAREALKPSDQEAIAKAAAFREKLKAKISR